MTLVLRALFCLTFSSNELDFKLTFKFKKEGERKHEGGRGELSSTPAKYIFERKHL